MNKSCLEVIVGKARSGWPQNIPCCTAEHPLQYSSVALEEYCIQEKTSTRQSGSKKLGIDLGPKICLSTLGLQLINFLYHLYFKLIV